MADKKNKIKLIGKLIVESGLIWVGDPSDFVGQEERKDKQFSGKTWDDFIKEFNGGPVTTFKYRMGHEGLGVCIKTLDGDGVYDVYELNRRFVMVSLRSVDHDKLADRRHCPNVSPTIEAAAKQYTDSDVVVDSHGVEYSQDGKLMVKYPKDCINENYAIKDGVEVIGRNCFSGAVYLKQIQFPASLKVIGACAFECCESIESIIIPPSVKIIDACAFLCCENLREVTLSTGLENIGYLAFCGCYQLNITIPDSVKEIGSLAFDNPNPWNPNNVVVNIDKRNPYFKMINGNLISSDGRRLVYYRRPDNGIVDNIDDLDFRVIGHAGVDAGMLCIADPRYFVEPEVKNEYTFKSWSNFTDCWDAVKFLDFNSEDEGLGIRVEVDGDGKYEIYGLFEKNSDSPAYLLVAHNEFYL